MHIHLSEFREGKLQKENKCEELEFPIQVQKESKISYTIQAHDK